MRGDPSSPVRSATMSGWRGVRGDPALAEVHHSIAISTSRSPWRRALSFLGPGYLVAAGYMDPGNWATSLAGGSRFGYTLLFAALVSSLMAIVLQSLCARLAVASGRDLAQACRDSYPRAGLLRALGARRARHLRHRPCRSDRHGDRPQSAPRHPARDRRRHHRARRVPRALPAEQGLSLDRGVHHHAACRDRGLLRRADRARAARILGGARRLRARSADRDQPGHALPGARHPRRDRDAAQPLSPYGDRADARLWRHAAGEARGDPLRDDRFDRRAALRPDDQRLHPDPGGSEFSRPRTNRRWRISARRIRCSRRCSARRLRRRSSPSRCSAAGSPRR